MNAHEVNWHEGMFLVPHHFQAAHRHARQIARKNSQFDLHYNWGLRSIDIDLGALENYRFVVRSLDARLRDGTVLSVPDDAPLPQLDLREPLTEKTSVTIQLAVPEVQLGRANIEADGARFRVETAEIDDENTGLDQQVVQFRRMNLRLLTTGEDQPGYELLPIARIEKSARAEAVPQLDPTYIPPILACDAWAGLQNDILQPIYDRIGKKVKLLASQVTSRGINFDSRGQGDTLIFEQLRALNEAYSYLGVQVFARGVHPLDSYLELARVVGRLAIFGATREPQELPRYDHDDLGRCFFAAKRYLDALGDTLVEPTYKERPFVGAGLRMQVSLEPSWLEPAWQMFVGVQSNLETMECAKLLTRGMDMKLGSSETVDEIYRLGQQGLRFTHEPTPPRALPPGQTYFQIDRKAKEDEWKNIQRTLTVAIRLNEKLITGSIQGQRVLTVRHGGQGAALQFTLFVVPQ